MYIASQKIRKTATGTNPTFSTSILCFHFGLSMRSRKQPTALPLFMPPARFAKKLSFVRFRRVDFAEAFFLGGIAN
jgi:hypothetical protein